MSDERDQSPEDATSPAEQAMTDAAVATPEQQEPGDADEALAATPDNANVLAESRRRTRRSFVVAGAAAAAGYGFYRWLGDGPSDEAGNNLLRQSLRFDAAVSREVFRDGALAPTYPVSRAEALRVNGVYGLKRELKTEDWRLQLAGMKDAAHHPRFTQDLTAWEYRYSGATGGDMGHDTKVDASKEVSSSGLSMNGNDAKGKQNGSSAQGTAAKMAPENMLSKAQADEEKSGEATGGGSDLNGTGRRSRGDEEAGESASSLRPGTPGLLLTLEDVVAGLPKHELVTEFKCIEGWSQIVRVSGVRMLDFLEMYSPDLIEGKAPRYVYMETPDGNYYCGYDMHVMRHPQTLLVTEMMGAPLTQFHGAPLRLHMPTKYGYKQIKRIGLIAYTNDRPDDYWTKLGYDWYAGL